MYWLKGISVCNLRYIIVKYFFKLILWSIYCFFYFYRIFIWEDGSLEINNIIRNDGGIYTCFVENNRGKVNSIGIFVIIGKKIFDYYWVFGVFLVWWFFIFNVL